jgi:hypothetical protein
MAQWVVTHLMSPMILLPHDSLAAQPCVSFALRSQLYLHAPVIRKSLKYQQPSIPVKFVPNAQGQRESDRLLMHVYMCLHALSLND